MLYWLLFLLPKAGMCTIQKAERICCSSVFSEIQGSKDLSGHVVSLSPSTDNQNRAASLILQGWQARQDQRHTLSAYSFQGGAWFHAELTPYHQHSHLEMWICNKVLIGTVEFLSNVHGYQNTAKNTSHQVTMMFSFPSWNHRVVTGLLQGCKLMPAFPSFLHLFEQIIVVSLSSSKSVF